MPYGIGGSHKKGDGTIRVFQCKTEICFGADALGRLGQMDVQRAVLVTDPFFAKNGTAKVVAGRLTGAEVAVFDKVEPDPDLRLVAQGLAVMQKTQPQLLVALGGGSAIDCAKAMAHFYEAPVTFAAIPTTSGTGSEVTSFSILSHDGVKHPLVDASLQPDIAILDDSLLQQLPPSLVADAGMDVLAHCLEAVAAKNSSPFSMALANESFGVVYEQLEASFRGDTAVRADIHMAATMAGLAFDHAGLGLCHGLAHALGGAFHKPHGRLNGVLLPKVVEFNAACAARAYRGVAIRCGVAAATDLLTVRRLCAALQHLRRELKMPATLQEAGIEPSQLRQALPDLARAALADPCCATNPRPVTDEAARQLLLAVAT